MIHQQVFLPTAEERMLNTMRSILFDKNQEIDEQRKYIAKLEERILELHKLLAASLDSEQKAQQTIRELLAGFSYEEDNVGTYP